MRSGGLKFCALIEYISEEFALSRPGHRTEGTGQRPAHQMGMTGDRFVVTGVSSCHKMEEGSDVGCQTSQKPPLYLSVVTVIGHICLVVLIMLGSNRFNLCSSWQGLFGLL